MNHSTDNIAEQAQALIDAYGSQAYDIAVAHMVESMQNDDAHAATAWISIVHYIENYNASGNNNSPDAPHDIDLN